MIITTAVLFEKILFDVFFLTGAAGVGAGVGTGVGALFKDSTTFILAHPF